jgi:signal transduction histidine kinase
MASELSHDLNNQLAAALNYAAIVERRLGAESPLAEHMEELRASLWRATSAAAALRLVGRRGSDQPEPIEFDQLLAALAPVLRHVTPACSLEIVPAIDIAPVRARRADVERLIVAITLYAYSRRMDPQGLRLRAESLERGHACGAALAGSWVRVRCEIDQKDGSIDGEPPMRGRLVARAGLRRALKRCGARIGHDSTCAWVDLPVANS